MNIVATVFLSSVLILSSFQLLKLGREIKCQIKEKTMVRTEFLSNLASPKKHTLLRIRRCKAFINYQREQDLHKFTHGKKEIVYKANSL
jgi:hypothetical protein